MRGILTRLPADHPARLRADITQRLAGPMTHLYYSPPPYLANPHVQTVIGAYYPTPRLSRKRERLELPDGDFIDVDWLDCPSAHGVMIFHGLGGSSEAPYVRALQHRLRAQGWGSVAVNARGASGVPNRLARAYHAGAGEDVGLAVDAVLAAARARGVSKGLWHLVGFSLGGSMIVNWWSEQPRLSRLPVGLCVAASIPLDLAQCADALNTGMGVIYQRALLRSAKQYYKRKMSYLAQSGYDAAAQELGQYYDCLTAKSFWEFDDVYIAPLHGFENVKDYYTKASPAGQLNSGQWPLLVLQAEDDPLVPAVQRPMLESLPQNVKLKWYRRGGHVGFLNWQNGWLVRQLPRLIADSLAWVVR